MFLPTLNNITMIQSKERPLYFTLLQIALRMVIQPFCNLKTILMENFAILGGKVLVIKFYFIYVGMLYYYNTHKKCSVGI